MILTNQLSSTPGFSGEILFFPRMASGNIAPIENNRPSTSLCNPIGLFFDALHDGVVVTNSAAKRCGLRAIGRHVRGDRRRKCAPVHKIGPGLVCPA